MNTNEYILILMSNEYIPFLYRYSIYFKGGFLLVGMFLKNDLKNMEISENCWGDFFCESPG